MGDNWINAIVYGKAFNIYLDALLYASKYSAGTEYGLTDLSDTTDSDIYKAILSYYDSEEYIKQLKIEKQIEDFKVKDAEIKQFAEENKVQINKVSKVYKIFTTSGLEGVSKFLNKEIKDMKELITQIEYDNFYFKNGFGYRIRGKKYDKLEFEKIKSDILDNYINKNKDLKDIHPLLLPFFEERKTALKI